MTCSLSLSSPDVDHDLLSLSLSSPDVDHDLLSLSLSSPDVDHNLLSLSLSSPDVDHNLLGRAVVFEPPVGPVAGPHPLIGAVAIAISQQPAVL